MASSPRVLPQELVDQILDDVADFEAASSVRGTLSNCTLVCHSWDDRAARHLLKRVSVIAPRFKAFLRLASVSMRIPTFTEELSILGTVCLFDQWMKMFAAIPKLSSLEIWSNLVVLDQDVPSDTAIGVHALANLKIHCVNLDHLPLFLRPFSRVDNLSLRSMISGESVAGEQGEPAPQISPLQVGRLILENCCDFETLRLLRDLVHPTALHANELLRRNFNAVHAVLKHTAADIEELALHPTREYTPLARKAIDLPWDSIRPTEFPALGMCSKLRFLELDIADVAWGASLFKGILLHMPEGVERLRVTLGFNQWTRVLKELQAHFSAGPTRHANLALLELCGLCEGSLLGDEQTRLRELEAEVQSCLPPRYSTLTKLLP